MKIHEHYLENKIVLGSFVTSAPENYYWSHKPFADVSQHKYIFQANATFSKYIALRNRSLGYFLSFWCLRNSMFRWLGLCWNSIAECQYQNLGTQTHLPTGPAGKICSILTGISRKSYKSNHQIWVKLPSSLISLRLFVGLILREWWLKLLDLYFRGIR